MPPQYPPLQSGRGWAIGKGQERDGSPTHDHRRFAKALSRLVGEAE